MMRSLPALRNSVNNLLAFIYPENCQICELNRAGPVESFVCSDCLGQIKWVEAPFCDRCGLPYEGEITTSFTCSNCADVQLAFSRARSAAAAKGVLLDIIHRYKYHRALWFEPLLAEVLLKKAAPDLWDGQWDSLVPIPLHRKRQREREFNQAERLARCLGDALAIPVAPNYLRRVIETRTQTQLTREQRRLNMRKAFEMVPGQSVTGRRLVLIDDVFTTGATSNACARLLKAAGAAEVCVWTVARGI
jgi:competence protein ComFC